MNVETGAKLGSSIPFVPLLGKLFANFTFAVKAGSDHHKKVRQELRQYPGQLVELTNSLLNSANEGLQVPDGLTD